MIDAFLFKKHLEDDEHVAVIVHKHWLIAVTSMFFPTVSFLASWILLAFMRTRTGLIILGLWSAISFVWWLRTFLDYYLNVWIVTDHGVIDLQWMGWFHRQSSRILYSDIEGVSTEIHGIVGTLLRYGDVTIEKISTGAAVSITQVPAPRKVEMTILRSMETYLHSKNLKNAKHIEELLSRFVAEHAQEDRFTKKKADAPAPQRVTKKSFTSFRVGGGE